MYKVFFVLCACIMQFGCSDSASLIKDSSYQSLYLNESSSVYVSIPKDAQDEGELYTSSGQDVMAIISSTLKNTDLLSVEGGDLYENYRDALESARSKGCDYLFYPTIIHWEDRSEELSDAPSAVSIKIVVIDVLDATAVSSATIKKESGLEIFGKDRPQDLLSDPVDDYVSGLFE